VQSLKTDLCSVKQGAVLCLQLLCTSSYSCSRGRLGQFVTFTDNSLNFWSMVTQLPHSILQHRKSLH